MLNNIKTLLGISLFDTTLDTKLNLMIANATARLRRFIGGIEPPEELNDIIIEVVVIRFNRIGSEGLLSHSVEGEALSFTEDDFKGFKDDIQAFLDKQKDTSRGKVRFI